MDHEVKPFEALYQRYCLHLAKYLPDGIVDVDLPLLHSMHLLDYEEAPPSAERSLTHYFQVVETEEKIILVNQQFVIWIVPSQTQVENSTRVFIALQKEGEPHLELAFSVSGVYNTSKLLLRILEKYLEEIHENEEFLCHLKQVN